MPTAVPHRFRMQCQVGATDECKPDEEEVKLKSPTALLEMHTTTSTQLSTQEDCSILHYDDKAY